LGRFGGGLVLGRTTFRILTELVESSDDGMIRRLQLEHFHISLVGLGNGSAMVLEAVGMLRVGWPLGALHGSTRQKC
jgi:hypothetical protein